MTTNERDEWPTILEEARPTTRLTIELSPEACRAITAEEHRRRATELLERAEPPKGSR